MSELSKPGTRLRQVWLWHAVGVALIVLCLLLGRAAPRLEIPSGDFPNYWTPGRANALGVNPYAPDQLIAAQRAAGWPREVPVTSWYPPWVLTVFMPFGLLPYAAARALWLLLGLATLLGCTTWLWCIYGGAADRSGRAWAAVLTFAPALFALLEGQVSPLVLLGITGFLHFQRRARWLAAGACASLVLLKPQLPYLFLAVLALWLVRERHWRVLAGLAAALLAALAVAAAANPAVIAQYAGRIGHYPAEYFNTPTIGAGLRMLFGREHFWLQFIAPVAGLGWLAWRWWRLRQRWDWIEQMPLVLLVSLATAPVAWMHDQVVSLVAVVQVAAWLARSARPWPRVPVALYLGINVVALAALPALRFDQFWYIWMPFALLGLYLVTTQPLTGKR